MFHFSMNRSKFDPIPMNAHKHKHTLTDTLCAHECQTRFILMFVSSPRSLILALVFQSPISTFLRRISPQNKIHFYTSCYVLMESFERQKVKNQLNFNSLHLISSLTNTIRFRLVLIESSKVNIH